MSTYHCTMTEIVIAIGDQYWRCIACQLRFSRQTSIDDHVLSKHRSFSFTKDQVISGLSSASLFTSKLHDDQPLSQFVSDSFPQHSTSSVTLTTTDVLSVTDTRTENLGFDCDPHGDISRLPSDMCGIEPFQFHYDEPNDVGKAPDFYDSSAVNTSFEHLYTDHASLESFNQSFDGCLPSVPNSFHTVQSSYLSRDESDNALATLDLDLQATVDKLVGDSNASTQAMTVQETHGPIQESLVKRGVDNKIQKKMIQTNVESCTDTEEDSDEEDIFASLLGVFEKSIISDDLEDAISLCSEFPRPSQPAAISQKKTISGKDLSSEVESQERELNQQSAQKSLHPEQASSISSLRNLFGSDNLTTKDISSTSSIKSKAVSQLLSNSFVSKDKALPSSSLESLSEESNAHKSHVPNGANANDRAGSASISSESGSDSLIENVVSFLQLYIDSDNKLTPNEKSSRMKQGESEKGCENQEDSISSTAKAWSKLLMSSISYDFNLQKQGKETRTLTPAGSASVGSNGNGVTVSSAQQKGDRTSLPPMNTNSVSIGKNTNSDSSMSSLVPLNSSDTLEAGPVDSTKASFSSTTETLHSLRIQTSDREQVLKEKSKNDSKLSNTYVISEKKILDQGSRALHSVTDNQTQREQSCANIVIAIESLQQADSHKEDEGPVNSVTKRQSSSVLKKDQVTSNSKSNNSASRKELMEASVSSVTIKNTLQNKLKKKKEKLLKHTDLHRKLNNESGALQSSDILNMSNETVNALDNSASVGSEDAKDLLSVKTNERLHESEQMYTNKQIIERKAESKRNKNGPSTTSHKSIAAKNLVFKNKHGQDAKNVRYSKCSDSNNSLQPGDSSSRNDKLNQENTHIHERSDNETSDMAPVQDIVDSVIGTNLFPLAPRLENDVDFDQGFTKTVTSTPKPSKTTSAKMKKVPIDVELRVPVVKSLNLTKERYCEDIQEEEKDKELDKGIKNGGAEISPNSKDHSHKEKVAKNPSVGEDLTCSVCDLRFTSAIALDRHIKVNSVAGSTDPCRCKVCGSKFHNLFQLNIHIYRVHEDKKKPSCFTCNAKLSTVKSLRQHILRHKETSMKSSSASRTSTWTCNVCGIRMLNHPRIIATHSLKHAGKHTFPCQRCGKTFPTRSAHNIHMATHDGKMFECDVCGQFFSSRLSRYHHKLTHIKDKGSFPCQLCGEKFEYQHKLNAHMRIHVKEPRQEAPSFYCEECGRKYKSKRYLSRHLAVEHKGIKDYQYKCDQCSKQFFTAWQLRNHVAWQHFGKKPYHCHECGQTFVCNPTLLRHQRKVHKRAKPHSCKHCGEMYDTKGKLFHHQVKVHNMAYPHTCSHCGKGFVDARTLRSHIGSRHMGMRNHHCDLCGRGFFKTNHLTRHRAVCVKKLARPTAPVHSEPVQANTSLTSAAESSVYDLPEATLTAPLSQVISTYLANPPGSSNMMQIASTLLEHPC